MPDCSVTKQKQYLSVQWLLISAVRGSLAILIALILFGQAETMNTQL